MPAKKLNISEKQKEMLKPVLIIGLTFISLVIVPIVMSSTLTTYSSLSHVKEVIELTFMTIILGVLITGLLILTYLEKPYSRTKIILSLIGEILFIAYLIVSSKIEVMNVNVENTLIIVDTSGLYLYIIGIPILLMIRNTYNYATAKSELKQKLVILSAIRHAKKTNTRAQLKEYVNNGLPLNVKFRKKVLENFDNILRELEREQKPLIVKNNGYRLTSEGQNLFAQLEEKEKSKLKEKDAWIDEWSEKRPEEYEVWTEAELEVYSHKRKKVR